MNSNKRTLSRKVFVHEVINPPYAGHSIDAKINILNSKHLEISDLKKDDGQQSFTLKIIDSTSLGLQNFQEYNVEIFFDRILLACNLVLKSAAFSRHKSDSSHTIIERESSQSSGTKITRTPEGIIIEVNETLGITVSTHITAGFEENLDENRVLDILKKFDRLEGTNKTNLQVGDIKKSLDEYSAGMSSFDRIGIFKHLYSSMELATNCDGNDRTGSRLDNEVNKIVGTPSLTVQNWREFNDRSKHINRNSQEEKWYQENLSRLGEKLSPLRETCQKIILDRLQNI
jgi:hypothetical protein